ncbi:putative phenylalanine--tRNA ligase alpha subunit [Morus notabilis]|uniref:phenylalanine--tRNA ligase n=1 Tax=Morus notabilis TaxID=981085 RepID=W9RY38_9ROSA|nr:putative phenylalanine--tRNA ligase alpha subunit [Morus notabilis]
MDFHHQKPASLPFESKILREPLPLAIPPVSPPFPPSVPTVLPESRFPPPATPDLRNSATSATRPSLSTTTQALALIEVFSQHPHARIPSPSTNLPYFPPFSPFHGRQFSSSSRESALIPIDKLVKKIKNSLDFWNFDALFQPQQHPARDSHDTFFLQAPSTTKELPEDYVERVKRVHESGGYDSRGYGYDWKRDEANKNLLRTHTTAVSSRMLYLLAQKPFVPKKYFSIDRVFRNEAVDRTHLAEFHQIEGLVCDRGLTLGDLIGVLHDFFSRLGMSKLRFKPAYNPYTEPSMEIFSYHEGFKKWVEVGNSGMFRPEMLLPMGLPEDVRVIAWGLSLERPTMILYGIDNIRDLFGPKVDLSLIKKNQICRLGI